MKRSALVAFVVLAIAPFAFAAARSSFWETRHSMAPVATLLYLALLAAVVVWRYRWAWVLLALFYGSAVIGWAFDSHRFAISHLVYGVADIAVFAFFISPAMRDRLSDAGSSRQRADWQREREALRKVLVSPFPSLKVWLRGLVAPVRMLGIAWRELLERIARRIRR